MKRTKQWWARLNKYERAQLVLLERADNQGGSMGGSGYLPEDTSECGACSTPHIGPIGLCVRCSNDLDKLIIKADTEVIK